jgi:type I restriction enzyme R subunit
VGLLELRYQNTHDAAAELGGTTLIRETFIDFQKHLYEGTPSAV